MSGGDIALIITALTAFFGLAGKAIQWLLKAQYEAGRAEEYRATAEQAILTKNKELEDARAMIDAMWKERATK